MTSIAYIGIGSNLGEPQVNCQTAIGGLMAVPETVVTQMSSLYETEPLGVKGQNWFINAVIEINTDLSPDELLAALFNIEKEMRRVRLERWGPRIIDLDLLFYENLILKKPGLEVPHPEIRNRSFVLIPLAEIRPDLIHPVFNQTIDHLVRSIPEKTTTRRLVTSN